MVARCDRHIGAAAVFSGYQRVGLLLAFALLVVLRLPRAWLNGRFLDEEGTIFFAFAWHRPTLAALGRSFGGYLNLGANATTLIDARLVRGGSLSLENAPYLTMTLALVFQLLPAILLLTGRGRWLANRWAVLFCLSITACSPMTEEVFANVLHIQFHLALCAGLILALDTPRAWMARIGYWVLLILAPLCGPGAIVLLPFYALRTVVDRDRGRCAQTIIFAVATAVQLLVFFVPSPVRGHVLPPATVAGIMVLRLAIMPFASSILANVVGHWMYLSYFAKGFGWLSVPLLAIVYFAGLLWIAVRDRRDPAIWLIAPGLAIAAASFGGGMIASDASDWFSMGAGERYNFLPLVMTGMGLVLLALRPRARLRRTFITLCLLTILSCAITYAQPIPELSTGPLWSQQVRLWRADRDHALQSWPAAWSVDLSDRDRPCSPRSVSPRNFADPSYCESAWLARVWAHTLSVRASLAQPSR